MNDPGTRRSWPVRKIRRAEDDGSIDRAQVQALTVQERLEYVWLLSERIGGLRDVPLQQGLQRSLTHVLRRGR